MTGIDYVPDLTCCLRKKRRWSDGGGYDSVICGRVNAEQYLRQGYTFDWEMTDHARACRLERIALDAAHDPHPNKDTAHDHP